MMTLEEKRAKNREKSRVFRANNPTYMRDFTRQSRANDPERVHAVKQKYSDTHKDELRVRSRDWRAKNPERARALTVQSMYNISAEDYTALLAAQNGCCALCARPPSGKRRLHVDHDHATGKVRALLCHHCNVGLGHFKDDSRLLEAAIVYLAKHAEKKAA